MKTCELFVDGGKEIRDQKGNLVSVARAKKLWKSGAVNNCNLSFQRLATQCDFDFAKLKEMHRQMDAARGFANNERHIIVPAEQALPDDR